MGNALYEEIDRLKVELEKWKSKVEEYRAALALVERDRDFWREMATRGGGNGN